MDHIHGVYILETTGSVHRTKRMGVIDAFTESKVIILRGQRASLQLVL